MAVSAEALGRAVAPILTAAGLDLEEVVIRPAGRRSLVRVVVDADGGVSLDVVAAVSGPISDAIDDSGLLGESPYTLEVSSPGVDRPLTEPRHWRRASGRLVAVTTDDGDEFTGRVTSADDDSVTFDVDGKQRELAQSEVRRAVVQVEFNAPADDSSDGEEG